MRLKGKTAFISGAGRNSGKAIALTFAREGADLVLVAQQRAEELNAVAKECEKLGAKVLPLLGDISKEDECNRMAKAGLDKFGKVDVLVSVAAIRPLANAWEYKAEDWLHVFDVNVHATFYLAKALVPGMIERKTGSIIALGGSSMVTVSSGHGAAVVASKMALHGLIKSLAMGLAPHGVRANLLGLANIENVRVHPEWYADMEKHGRPGIDSVEHVKQRSPMGRKGTNQEVANVALFLASDESSYVTGDRILCAGGMQV
jgi:3-oxoacyl-[acyl-carrier protein] reductase